MYLGQPFPLEELRRRSVLVDLLFSAGRLIQAHLDPDSALRRSALNIFDEHQADSADIRRGWDQNKAGYERLAAVAASHKIPLVVVVIPTDGQIRTAEPLSNLPQSTFLGICDQLQLACFDLLPSFREAAARDPSAALFFDNDPHWSPAGHELAAQLLREHLASLDWLSIGR
jgi:hypothetical protein